MPDAVATASRLTAMLPQPVGVPVIVPGRATDPAVAQRVVARIERPGAVPIIAGLVPPLLIGLAIALSTAPPTSG